jgi:hypothetical protein
MLKSASETYAKLSETSSTEAVRKLNACEWPKWFEEDWENLEDTERSSRLKAQTSDGNVEKVRNVVSSEQAKRWTRLIM